MDNSLQKLEERKLFIVKHGQTLILGGIISLVVKDRNLTLKVAMTKRRSLVLDSCHVIWCFVLIHFSWVLGRRCGLVGVEFVCSRFIIAADVDNVGIEGYVWREIVSSSPAGDKPQAFLHIMGIWGKITKTQPADMYFSPSDMSASENKLFVVLLLTFATSDWSLYCFINWGPTPAYQWVLAALRNKGIVDFLL